MSRLVVPAQNENQPKSAGDAAVWATRLSQDPSRRGSVASRILLFSSLGQLSEPSEPSPNQPRSIEERVEDAGLPKFGLPPSPGSEKMPLRCSGRFGNASPVTLGARLRELNEPSSEPRRDSIRGCFGHPRGFALVLTDMRIGCAPTQFGEREARTRMYVRAFACAC